MDDVTTSGGIMKGCEDKISGKNVMISVTFRLPVLMDTHVT